MAFILWILAVILVVGGIVQLFRGQLLFGIVLIVVGLLVGPGGVSLFTGGTDDNDGRPLRELPAVVVCRVPAARCRNPTRPGGFQREHVLL